MNTLTDYKVMQKNIRHLIVYLVIIGFALCGYLGQQESRISGLNKEIRNECHEYLKFQNPKVQWILPRLESKLHRLGSLHAIQENDMTHAEVSASLLLAVEKNMRPEIQFYISKYSVLSEKKKQMIDYWVEAKAHKSLGNEVDAKAAMLEAVNRSPRHFHLLADALVNFLPFNDPGILKPHLQSIHQAYLERIQLNSQPIDIWPYVEKIDGLLQRVKEFPVMMFQKETRSILLDHVSTLMMLDNWIDARFWMESFPHLSMEEALKNGDVDSLVEGIRVRKSLADIYFHDRDISDASKIYELTIELCKSSRLDPNLNHPKIREWQSSSGINLAHCYLATKRGNMAMQIYQDLIPQLDDNDILKIVSLNNMAVIHFLMKDESGSSQYMSRCLSLARKMLTPEAETSDHSPQRIPWHANSFSIIQLFQQSPDISIHINSGNHAGYDLERLSIMAFIQNNHFEMMKNLKDPAKDPIMTAEFIHSMDNYSQLLQSRNVNNEFRTNAARILQSMCQYILNSPESSSSEQFLKTQAWAWKACELTNFKNPDAMEILAESCAALQQWEGAIHFQKLAISDMPEANKTRAASNLLEYQKKSRP